MDIQYLLFLQSIREATGGIFDKFFLFITTMGEETIPILLIAGIYWCLDKKIGIFLLFNVYWSALINGFLKITACIYRPWIRSEELVPVKEALETATGYSFPSGHTARATAVWAGLAYLNWRDKPLRYAFLSILLLVAFSRNYLGVHTPQDVVVSAAVGIGLIIAVYKTLEWVDAGAGRDTYILSSGIILSIILIVYAVTKTYPMDYINGKLLVDPVKMSLDSISAAGHVFALSIGWFCERRWLKFSLEGTISQKLVRFIVGAILLELLMFSVKPICSLLFNTTVTAFGSSMLIVLFIVYLYPAIFNWKIKKQSRET